MNSIFQDSSFNKEGTKAKFAENRPASIDTMVNNYSSYEGSFSPPVSFDEQSINEEIPKVFTIKRHYFDSCSANSQYILKQNIRRIHK